MKKKLSLWKIITGIALTFLAVFMIHGSLTVLPEANESWEKNSIQVSGTVIDLKETFRNKTYCDYIVIEFISREGEKITFTPYDCYSKGSFTIGKQVAVRYKKDDSSQAYIDSPSHDKASNTAVYIISGLLLISGISLIAYGFKGNEVLQQG